MTQHLTCDALISYRTPFMPKPGGALLQLGEDQSQWAAHAMPWLHQQIKYAQQTCGFALTGPQTQHEIELVHAIADHYSRAQVQQRTIARFAVEWGRNFCETLKRSPRWATSLREPWAGRPAFVVSAGPSLDRNGQLLADAQKRGPVIALNSSAKACLGYGVVPDLVMCSEAVDVADKLAPLRELGVQIALDAVANPLNWQAAPDAWAYAWAEPNLVPYVLELGALPLNYTGSVACAAVALAILWGADPVVLIGQDCAYTDGRMYASGTPYADIRCEMREDGIITFTGASKECAPLLGVQRASWGGSGMVATSHDLEVFIDWFRTAAATHTIVNATEGGARIEYTYEVPLARIVNDLPERDRVLLPTPELADHESVRKLLRTRAREMLADADSITPPSDFPLLHMWAVPATFESHGKQPLERHRIMRAAMERGAREILEVLG